MRRSPMGLSPIRLGLVFTGWGILVAIFAVFGAPRLQASLGIARAMYLNLAEDLRVAVRRGRGQQAREA